MYVVVEVPTYVFQALVTDGFGEGAKGSPPPTNLEVFPISLFEALIRLILFLFLHCSFTVFKANSRFIYMGKFARMNFFLFARQLPILFGNIISPPLQSPLRTIESSPILGFLSFRN